MATIKAFTDINQSQKLAEILPTESADAWWAERHEGKVTYDGQYIVNEEPFYYISFIKPSEINYSQDTVKDIPCWSLAALLDVLPHRIDDRHALVSGKLFANEGWYVCYDDDDNGDIDYYVHNSSLIDACYEMILKLHEQKLL